MRDRLRAAVGAMVDACGRPALLRLQVLQLAGAVLEAVVLALLIPLTQVLAGADEGTLPWTSTSVRTSWLVAAVLAAVTLRAGVQWLVALLGASIRIRTSDLLRLRALDGVLGADWVYLARQRRSDIVHATTTEMERVEAALVLLLRVQVALVGLLATVAVGVAISPTLGIALPVILLLVALAGRSSIRSSLDLGMEGTRSNALFGATVSDSLSSLRLVRAHDAAAAWSRLLRESVAAVRRVETRYVETTVGLQAALGVAGVVLALAVVLVGRALGLGVGELVAFGVVTTRVIALARGLVESAQAFAHAAPGIDVVRRLAEETRAHRAPAGPEGIATGTTEPAARVELRAVSAGYGPQPAVRGLSTVLPAGSLVAVTGPSGAGKSTLLDVLLGLLPPAAGEVLVDGSPLADLATWRAGVGYVPQDTVLVPGTIRENLTWSAGREVGDDVLWAALDTACAAELVAGQPAGLDTVLTDTVALSGGEQQRLCIARALVRAPRLLVLDEATSALDAATETAVVERLRRLPCTIVAATHRPAITTAADLEIRLDGPARDPQLP